MLEDCGKTLSSELSNHIRIIRMSIANRRSDNVKNNVHYVLDTPNEKSTSNGRFFIL